MQYNNLGKTGLKISKLSFGSWITFGNQVGNETADRLMSIAYDHGVNFFDNAEIYADGRSEEVMGDILAGKKWDRSSYIISSKVFFGDGGKKPNQSGLSRKHITEACHKSLKRFKTNYLDLYFCHRPDKSTPVEETVRTMNTLIEQGKVLYWGTSEWSAQEIMEAHMVAREHNLIGPVMEQPQYNMFHRRKVEVEFSQIYKTVGLGTTIWSPLASGVLTDKYLDKFPGDTRLGMEDLEWLKERALTEEKLIKVRSLNKLAGELDTSLAQLAIAWCAKNENVSTVILGASKEEQLLENLKALNLLPDLTDEILDKIEEILQNKPPHPAF
jgi:voltage-dependent potassium channel beta subunit